MSGQSLEGAIEQEDVDHHLQDEDGHDGHVQVCHHVRVGGGRGVVEQAAGVVG